MNALPCDQRQGGHLQQHHVPPHPASPAPPYDGTGGSPTTLAASTSDASAPPSTLPAVDASSLAPFSANKLRLSSVGPSTPPTSTSLTPASSSSALVASSQLASSEMSQPAIPTTTALAAVSETQPTTLPPAFLPSTQSSESQSSYSSNSSSMPSASSAASTPSMIANATTLPSTYKQASQGNENLNAVATTSAYTLDSAPLVASGSAQSPNRSPRITSSPIKVEEQLHSSGIPASLGSQQASYPIPPTTSSSSVDPQSSNVVGGAMLNEEDAKLLASLADGNGLLAHLSGLSQSANPSSVDFGGGGSLPSMPDNLFQHVKSETIPADFSMVPGLDTAALNGAVDLNEELVGDFADWDDDLVEGLDEEGDDDDDQGPIQAYAKLDFPGFSYYIQTLDVSIGRRPGQLQSNLRGPLGVMPELPTAASGSSQAHITSESQAGGHVDVDLGPLKSISRLHARIFYYTGPMQPSGHVMQAGSPIKADPATPRQQASPYRLASPGTLSRTSAGPGQASNGPAGGHQAAVDEAEFGTGQFVLSVVGRNGAFVDDVWVEKGGLVVLGKKTKIQIAERVFYFVLPPPPGTADPESAGALQRMFDSDSESLSDLDSDDEEDEGEADEVGSAVSGSHDTDGSDQRSSQADSSDLSEVSDGDDNKESSRARRLSLKATDPAAATPTLPRRRLVLKSKARMTEEQIAAESKSSVAASSTTGGELLPAKIGGAMTGENLAKGKASRGRSGKMPAKQPLPGANDVGMDYSDSLGGSSDEEVALADVAKDAKLEAKADGKTAAAPAGKRPAKGSKGAKTSNGGKGGKAAKAAKALEQSKESVSPSKKEGAVPSWAMGAGIAGRKRKRGEGVVDDEPALKVGTPIGIEALEAQRRAKAAKARAASPTKAVATATLGTDTAAIEPVKASVSAADEKDGDVVMADVASTPASASVQAAKPVEQESASSASSAPSAADSGAPAINAAQPTSVVPVNTAITANSANNANKANPAATSTPANTAKPKAAKTAKKKKDPPPAALSVSNTGKGAESKVATAAISTTGPSAAPVGSTGLDSNSAASAIIAAANALGQTSTAPSTSAAAAPVQPPPVTAPPIPFASAISLQEALAGAKSGPPKAASMPASKDSAKTKASVSTTSGTGSGASAVRPLAASPAGYPYPTASTPSAASLSTRPFSMVGSTVVPIAPVNLSGNPMTSSGPMMTPFPANMAAAGPNIPLSAMQQPVGTARPPPGPEDKPDLSNIELISFALRSEHCARKGGKLTLQEVYEWISNRWVWFKRNGRHTGRDWQSSVRHAIGSSRDFTKIPRRADEPGKGIFYCMSDSELAQRRREAMAKEKEEAAKAAAAGPASGAATTTATTSSAALSAGLTKASANGTTFPADAAATAKPPDANAAMPAVKIPLVIGTAPAAPGASPLPDKPKAAPGTIESLLETPPIVHHDGKLFLSPQVFGHLNAGQLAHIEGLGAQQALQVLQAYLVSHLKERMRLQQLSLQQKKGGPSSASAPGPTSVSAPATGESPKGTTTAAAAAAQASDTTPAKAPVRAAQLPASANSGSAASTGAAAKPSPAAAPPSVPSTAASVSKLGTRALPGAQPARANPSTPTQAVAHAVPRPPVVAARPLQPSIPSAGSSAPKSSPLVPSGVPSSAPGSKAKPAQAPISTSGTTPNLPTSVPVSAPSKSGPSPSPVAQLTSSAASAPLAPVAAAAAISPAATPAASLAATAATSGEAVPVASTEPRASPVPSSAQQAGPSAAAESASASAEAATPTAASKAGSPASEDPLSALSALAAHPEAAALIALLKRQQSEGGSQLAKLTPGQLQLLQMANKLAAQQKKARKKKAKGNKDGKEGAAASTSGSPAPTSAPAGGVGGSGAATAQHSPAPTAAVKNQAASPAPSTGGAAAAPSPASQSIPAPAASPTHPTV